ncbi:protein of unknown function DUF6, transmembrane [Oxalobacteraceae bacterium IMCC9480]|nr:protein of unknown function DUF6, transmembrane [Oxalobacteraceae bacterium IMCC9480]NDP58457.1 DMT family transporter [Oxalobacteraceae bacterium]
MFSLVNHRRAVLLMIIAAVLWSSAGVMTRQLESARGFEVTFWRSFFAAVFVLGALRWQQHGRVLTKLRNLGLVGLVSGAMWATMFCCFMIALTMTTVANTLIVLSVAPLLTALLAWLFLRQHIAPRTWLAIAVASSGIGWMFSSGVSHVSGTSLVGMGIAFGAPLAASVNFILLKKAGAQVDLIPAVLVGATLSALAMLPFSWPMQASLHDVAILAGLGFFQLGLPCMMVVTASRALSAPEMSLLALVEVLLGPVWAWLGAGEIPATETLVGGALVIAALVFNELVALRRPA